MERELLEYALVGYTAQRDAIELKIADLRQRLGDTSRDEEYMTGSWPSVEPAEPEKKRRTMSPESRRRIAAAQKKRWAKVKRTTVSIRQAGTNWRKTTAGKKILATNLAKARKALALKRREAA